MWLLNFEVYNKEKDQGKYAENLIDGGKTMEKETIVEIEEQYLKVWSKWIHPSLNFLKQCV